MVVFGTPDSEDGGSHGEKGVMHPCSTDPARPNELGCGEVLWKFGMSL
jgi:hypothetical protein